MTISTCCRVRPPATAGASRFLSWLMVLALSISGCSDDVQPASNGYEIDEQIVAEIASDAEGSGFGDPYQIDLPAVEDPEATVAWLTGEGATAVGLVTQAARLWAEDEPDCIGIADALDELGSPTDLRAAVLQTPDPVTADLLLSVHMAVIDLLGSCDQDHPPSSEHAWQWTVAHRRLRELTAISP